MTFLPSGTLKTLSVKGSALLPGGETATFTLRKGGVSTSITCTMTGPSNVCTDNTHTVVSAGENYDIMVVTSAATGTLNYNFSLLKRSRDAATSWIGSTAEIINISRPSMTRQRKPDRKDQAMYLCAVLLGVAMFQVHQEIKQHIDDCSKKSALVVKILSGVAVMVLGELIMKGFSLFKLAGSCCIGQLRQVATVTKMW